MDNTHSVKSIIKCLTKRVSLLKTSKLNANLGRVRVDDHHYTHLGGGDDGDVILAENQEGENEEYVLKVYKRFIMKNDAYTDIAAEDQKEMDDIVADQALREFTALELMRGHPNVSRLISTEVDTCHLHIDGQDFPGSILIRMEYIPHAITLEDIKDDSDQVDMATIGVVRTMRGPDESFHIDFGVRAKLIGYLFGQCFSLSDELRRHRIHHRDCDNCNIAISFPSLRLVLLDFARADMPGLQKTEDIIKKRTSYKMKKIRIKRYRNLNMFKKTDFDSIFYNLKTVIMKSCGEGFFKSYIQEMEAMEVMIDIMKSSPGRYDSIEPPVEPLRQFQEVWDIYTLEGPRRFQNLDDAVNNEILLQLLQSEDSDEEEDNDSDEALSLPHKIAKS